MTLRTANRLAVYSLILLIMLCFAWELRWAPLHAGGSWLALIKTLPLLFVLPGVMRGKRKTHQGTALLALAYLAEGVVRAMTEGGLTRVLASAEALLALTGFFGCILFARLLRGRDAG